MKEKQCNPGYDKEIRHLIECETNLVNGRMNWLILSQTLLFTGYSTIYRQHPNSVILIIISTLGILLSIVVRHSFWINEKAIAFILTKWNKYIKDNNLEYDDFPPVWAGGDLKGVVRTKRDRVWSLFSPFLKHHIAIPYLFMLAWSAILIFNLIC